jgi:hypothetical protein
VASVTWPPMLPPMFKHLILTGLLASSFQAATATGAEQTIVLRDGRKLTGIYDEAAGTLTTSGPVKAVIRVAKADVVKVEAAAAAPATSVQPEDESRKQDPLAAIDLLIARKQQDKLEAENNAADAKKKAELERASATKTESAERRTMYADRAQRFGETAARQAAEASRLGTEIADLKRKRVDLEKELAKDAALAATRKVVDELTGKAATDPDSPLGRYRRIDGESRDLQAQIKTAQDQLTQNQAELAKLKPQLDLAMAMGLDLKEFPLVERPNESDSDRTRRVSEHKAYNEAMSALRQAKTEVDSGKTPNVQAPLTALRAEPMRRLHQEKTGRALVFWDEALKAADTRK